MRQAFLVLVAFSLFNFNLFSQDKKKIAFVDLTKVMQVYKKRIDFAADLKKTKAKFKVALENRYKKLKQISIDIKESTDEEEVLELQFLGMKGEKELKFFQELNNARLAMEYQKQYLELISDIKKAINDYGEEKSFFMILQTHPPMPKNEEAKKALMQMNVADVLYHNAEYDISKAIYNKLNQRYENKLRVLKKQALEKENK
ncbi:MAG: hypothetical protein COA79_19370 [Planctomycetota bacterium]|nr:MAG: hypothetical protein COA79_19370 [Planctomycetota bacterium]